MPVFLHPRPVVLFLSFKISLIHLKTRLSKTQNQVHLQYFGTCMIPSKCLDFNEFLEETLPDMN